MKYGGSATAQHEGGSKKISVEKHIGSDAGAKCMKWVRDLDIEKRDDNKKMVIHDQEMEGVDMVKDMDMGQDDQVGNMGNEHKVKKWDSPSKPKGSSYISTNEMVNGWESVRLSQLRDLLQDRYRSRS